MGRLSERGRRNLLSRRSRPSVQRARLPEARGWTPEEDVRGGQSLDPFTREAMESRFGHDFGSIRIHTGPQAARSAEGLGAHAYTLGLDVHFGQGRYRPDLPEGQALIAHELEHVARAGPRGPDVPRLQPKQGADHEANLRAILTAPKGQSAKLKQYLDANPASVEVAERLLVGKVAGKATVPLLRVVFGKDPKSEERVATLIRQSTSDLRWDAEKKTKAMWKNYETAAYEHALVKWATKRLDEEKKKRPRVPRGSPPPEPTPVELQIERWRKDAQARYDALARDRKTLLAESDAALEAMMAASEPLPYVQGDALEKISKRIHGTIDEAHRERIRSFEDLALLNLKASPWVEKQLDTGKRQLEKAKQDEKTAGEARAKLEKPAVSPSGAPETAAQKASRERRLEAAKRAESRSMAGRERAEKALTPEGARDPAVKAYLHSQDPAARKAAEDRLSAARAIRNKKLKPSIPKHTQQPVNRMALLDDEQRWWIYHTALYSIEVGFPGFSMEHSIRWIDKHRLKVAENLEALGKGLPPAIDTYDKHGAGQYDIHIAAGTDIEATLPDVVDLAGVYGSKQKRLFQRQSTIVWTAAQIGPLDGDEDVLAKLVYGYFGRELTDRAKMMDYLNGSGGGVRPNPDATRILGALTLENVIAGSPPSAEVAAARTAIRDAMETALRAELKKLKTPVEIPDDVKILRTVDASSGHFGGGSTISKEAYDVFLALRPKGWKYNKDTARAEVLKAARRIVLSDATVSAPLEKLMKDLFAIGKGNRSGPWVTLLHKYKEAATGQEAWVAVDYRHLHAVNVQAGKSVTAGEVIGKVGSSGNSISPHIHMGIPVYEKDPRGRGVLALGFLTPQDFFPFGRKGK